MRRVRRYLLISVLFFTSVSLCAGESTRNEAGSANQHRISFAYGRHTIESTYTSGRTESDNVNFFAIAPKMLFTWGGEVFSVYHGISLGIGLYYVTMEDANEERTREISLVPAAHFYLVGFNLKLAETVSLFADVGGGYLGSLNIGIGIYL